jgi:hypothetical protein
VLLFELPKPNFIREMAGRAKTRGFLLLGNPDSSFQREMTLEGKNTGK